MIVVVLVWVALAALFVFLVFAFRRKVEKTLALVNDSAAVIEQVRAKRELPSFDSGSTIIPCLLSENKYPEDPEKMARVAILRGSGPPLIIDPVGSADFELPIDILRQLRAVDTPRISPIREHAFAVRIFGYLQFRLTEGQIDPTDSRNPKRRLTLIFRREHEDLLRAGRSI